MLRYGTDKPDLRNPLEIRDLTQILQPVRPSTPSPARPYAPFVFRSAAKSRSFFDKLEEQAKNRRRRRSRVAACGADGTLKGPVAKFLTGAQPESLKQRLDAGVGDASSFCRRYRYSQSLPDPQRTARSPGPVARPDRAERLQVLLDRRFPDVRIRRRSTARSNSAITRFRCRRAVSRR